MNFDTLNAYQLILTQPLPDIRSEGYILEHKKSGARIMLIKNDDDNKVFHITFRTTPSDSTGVAHITEHSVLCGSRLFPSKDPFVELVKGSMNTFLNAMTYPDKTMYPVASCNDQDFANLMHVYMDAVFYPNTYRKEEIFRQEGWSYQLENPEDELTVNGVVYNEMKGAYSSPDDVLERVILNSLFPDNTYAYESGGDPECIPDLTYEDFLDFHRKFYHPSNSYIYLYGDMDFEERLKWMDEEYLSRFERIEVDSAVKPQEPFDKMKIMTGVYPLAEDDTEEHNTYLAYNAAIGLSTDTRLTGACAVLEYALLEMPGAPLKQALLDAQIGSDIMSSYDDGVRQPVFSVIAKYADVTDQDRFLSVIRETLTRIAEQGVDPKAIEAAVNSMEFRFREADYGNIPKGLMYGISVFGSWLYDETKPFDYVCQLDDYNWLREQIGTGYYEQVIRTWLLDNPHTSLVILKPQAGLTGEADERLRRKLQAFKDSLTKEQIAELIEKTRSLRAFQETPSTKEELEAIPMLSRGDLKKEIRPLRNEAARAGGCDVLLHDYDTNGIAYIELLLDASGISQDDLPYFGLLRRLLGLLGTENYTYTELANEININTGGVIPGISVFPDTLDNQKLKLALGVQVRVLFEKTDFAFDMIREILFTSDFSDRKRILELIHMFKSRTQTKLQSSGSATAASRCMAGFSAMHAVNDAIAGIRFYRLMEDLEENFDAQWEKLSSKLRSMMDTVLCSRNVVVSYTGTRASLPVLDSGLERVRNSLSEYRAQKDICTAQAPQEPLQLNWYPAMDLNPVREGFASPGQVQYVARCGNFREAGYDYTGAFRVLRTIMSYEYLWNQIRVVGGAYGCSGSANRCGDTAFTSYRDPHLRRTNEVYEGIPAFLRDFSVDDRDMDKYVIGTVSEMDTPLNPAALGSRSLHAWMCSLTEEQLKKERDEVLGACQEDIRDLAPLMEAVLSQERLCVVGSEGKLKEEADLFETIEAL